MNFSHRTTVLIIYFINILFALTSVFYVLGDKEAGGIVLVILTILLIWFVLYTNIITDKKPKIIKKIAKK